MENVSVQICEQIARSPQISEQSSKYKQLENILRDMFSNSVKEMNDELKYEKNNNPSSEDDILRPKLFVSIQRPDDSAVDNLALALTDQRKHFGRITKNPVVGEKMVCFDISEDFDVEGIENIGEIKDRLGKWRIQRRERKTKMKDTFYCHLSSRHTFRSIPEVLSFIMCGRQSKPSKKRSANSDDDGAETSEGDNVAISKSPSKRQRKYKGKLVFTSQGFIDQNTTDPNLDHSITPWRPVEQPQMNMYCYQCSRKIPLNPRPLSIVRCDNFVDLTQESSVENGIDFDSEMSEVTQDKVDDKSISDESPLKRGREDMKEEVDIQGETVEDDTYAGLESLDECKKLLVKTITFDEIVAEINDNNNNVILVSPPANVEETRKEIDAEKQALITTEPVESLSITESSNKQNQKSQDNVGAAENITSIEEAMQKLPHVELEGVGDDEEFYHFQHYAAYFSDCDPVHHISVYDYLI